MTTVGSLAYSIVANSQQFTAGVAASKAELRTLKEAFLSSQTPVERFSMAIDHLEQLAQKFPEKASGLRRTIAAMRTEMAGGFTEGAHGAGELDTALGKIDRKLGKMAISDVWSQLKEIPGATVALDIAFGNWIGAAIGAFSLAHELMEETREAVTKTADAYESATEKVIKFYEEEARAREKGRARDRVGGLPGDVEKATAELGMGQMGFAASNTTFGKMQRFWDFLESTVSRIEFGKPTDTNERAVELGRSQIAKEMESRKLAEDFTKTREQFFEDFIRDFDKAGVESERWLGEFWSGFEKAGEQAEKTRLDTINRGIEIEGRLYAENERRAEQIAKSQMNGAEKLRDEFTKLQELQVGGFFDLHPGAYEKSLADIRDKAEAMSDANRPDKGITSAVYSASREGVAARFGTQGTEEKQLREQVKHNENQKQTNALLTDIKAAIVTQPQMGVVQ